MLALYRHGAVGNVAGPALIGTLLKFSEHTRTRQAHKVKPRHYSLHEIEQTRNIALLKTFGLTLLLSCLFSSFII